MALAYEYEPLKRQPPAKVAPVVRALRELRRRLGITAAELGGMLDVSEPTIYALENGHRPLRPAKVERPRRLRSSKQLEERMNALLERWTADRPEPKRMKMGRPRKCAYCAAEAAPAAPESSDVREPLCPVATPKPKRDRRVRNA